MMHVCGETVTVAMGTIDEIASHMLQHSWMLLLQPMLLQHYTVAVVIN